MRAAVDAFNADCYQCYDQLYAYDYYGDVANVTIIDNVSSFESVPNGGCGRNVLAPSYDHDDIDAINLHPLTVGGGGIVYDIPSKPDDNDSDGILDGTMIFIGFGGCIVTVATCIGCFVGTCFGCYISSRRPGAITAIHIPRSAVRNDYNSEPRFRVKAHLSAQCSWLNSAQTLEFHICKMCIRAQ
jgi:hypothetical protein